MKLKDLIKLIKENNTTTPFGINCFDFSFSPEQLNLLKKSILDCDEFKEVTDLIIVDRPIFTNTKGKVLQVLTMKLGDELKFKGKVYLYSILLSPELYDPEKAYEPVKDGLGVSPLIYNPKDFSPMRRITMVFSPEKAQDDITNYKKELHNLLDKVLSNTEEYTVKGEKNVLIRGLWEAVEVSGTTTTYDIGEIDNDTQGYMAFYLKQTSMEPNENGIGQIGLTVTPKIIPAELRESLLKYMEVIGEKGLLREEQMKKWCDENNIEI